MAIVYKKSELGIFLEQLPQLLATYRMQNAQIALERELLEDKQEHESDMLTQRQDHDAVVSLYQDAKSEATLNRTELNTLENQYQRTGADLDDLNALFKTEASLKTLTAITEIPANDFKKRAEYYDDVASNTKQKIEVIEDALYGDIFKAQQIARGGRPGIGYQGGLDPDAWDIGDINYSAYVDAYGENPMIERMFENIPGDLTASLNELELSRLSQILKEETSKKHKKQSDDVELEDKATNAQLYLGTKVKDASIASGLGDYYNYLTVISDPENYDTESIDSANEAIPSIKIEIAEGLATLTGQHIDLNDLEGSSVLLENLFKQYSDAHSHATGTAESRLGITGEASFSYFEGMIEDAWENYKNKDEATQKELDILAQKLFGFTRMTFGEFVKEYNQYREDALVGVLATSNQNIIDVNDVESENYEDLFDDE